MLHACRYARIFVFCYTLALHLLIMGVLARWSHGHSQTLVAKELLQAQQVCNASSFTTKLASCGYMSHYGCTADMCTSSWRLLLQKTRKLLEKSFLSHSDLGDNVACLQSSEGQDARLPGSG